MISRVWYAWTTPDNADSYEAFLLDEIFPALKSGGHAGLQGIDLFRRPHEGEVEFMTVIWFASRSSLRAFAGDSEVAVVAQKDKDLLSRYDARVQHYDVRGHIRLT